MERTLRHNIKPISHKEDAEKHCQKPILHAMLRTGNHTIPFSALGVLADDLSDDEAEETECVELRRRQMHFRLHLRL